MTELVFPDHTTASLQRILVIDDDPAILRLVRDKLDRAGFEVITATSGQHALDVIERRGLPHLAIVDINMPGMDGFEFCRTVQQFTDLPVIMLTAVDEEEAVILDMLSFISIIFVVGPAIMVKVCATAPRAFRCLIALIGPGAARR